MNLGLDKHFSLLLVLSDVMTLKVSRIMRGCFVTVCLLALVLVGFGTVARAATTGVVTATVTVQNVSVTVSDGTIAYGTVSTSATEDTTTGGKDDSQTATNNGNVSEDLNILGQDSTAWTLGATAGSETYTHKFCITTCDSSPTWTALTTSYQTLTTAVAASGTQAFDLQIGAPTATTTYTEQSVDVTVQAVAS